MRTRAHLLAVAGLVAIVAARPSAAFERLDGCFVAESACQATTRIQDAGGGQGSVTLDAGRSYRLLGANRAEPTHLQIRIPAPSRDRWVPVACSRVVAACEPDGGAGGGGPPAQRPEYVLAVSWQPAFCEGHAGKPECRSQTPDRFDATHFTLHGLWPQPNGNFYCGVSPAVRAKDRPETWDELPPVELDARTRAALDEMMPGTRSALDRHEWIKHGTCYGGASQEEYFRESLQLLRELNASAVREVVAGRIGGEVTLDQLRAAFDAAFGAGAGERVAMECESDGPGRELLVELRLSLAGEITEATRLADLLAAAPRAASGCRAGEIDPVGPDP